MKRLLSACCLALLPAAALAVDIDIGGTELSVPAPGGYALLTEDMQPYADVAKRFVPPQNEQFAVFLGHVDAALAAQGEVPEPKRFFYVQTAKSIIDRFASIANFTEVKDAMKGQNEEIAKEIEAKMPGITRELNEGIRKDYDVDLAFSVSRMLPLPPHHESDRSLAFSMLTKYDMTDADGNPVSFEASVTATFVHVRGKILFLYAVGEKDDLDWTREASREWAAAVIAKNPSTGSIAERERRPSGFDWNGVLTYGIIGAVIAVLIGAVRQAAKRREARGGE
jgi:hypothetical protein